MTYNWWKNWRGFGQQDWRYDLLKEKNSRIYFLVNLIGIHLVPTIVVFAQLTTVYEYLTSQGLNFWFFVGLMMAIAAPIIQFIADRQMYLFRMENTNSKSVINTGLWRFSRHPNYFGELLFWVGIYVMSASGVSLMNPYLIAPLCMIALFQFISVPMMEKKLSDRQGYGEYRKTVSRIVPFFPRKQA